MKTWQLLSKSVGGGGYSVGYDDGYSAGHNDGYNAGHNVDWYRLTNSATRLTSVQNYDGTWTSSSYTAQEEGTYMVVSASGAAQAVGNAFANATTTGKILVSVASGQTNPSAEGWSHMSWQVIIAYLKVGQSIGGNARGSSSYGRSRVETYRIG